MHETYERELRGWIEDKTGLQYVRMTYPTRPLRGSISDNAGCVQAVSDRISFGHVISKNQWRCGYISRK